MWPLDTTFRLEAHEFRAMVEAIRTAEQALGEVNYEVTEQEQGSRAFRRSLFVVEDMEAGDEFTEHNVRSIRPGHGLHPRYLSQILRKRSNGQIARGTPLTWALCGAKQE